MEAAIEDAASEAQVLEERMAPLAVGMALKPSLADPSAAPDLDAEEAYVVG